MKSALSHWKETFEKERKGASDNAYDYKALHRSRLLEFRKAENAVVRIDKPTNLGRARSLGYKAKNGIVVARVAVRRGGGLHVRPVSGRKPRRMGIRKLTRKLNIQSIAERRAARAFANLEVLNSYWIGEDGKNKFFEVILVDPAAPEIRADKDLAWIAEPGHRRRVYRGKTSAAKKQRGLRHKGIGTEKIRPSLRANSRQGN